VVDLIAGDGAEVSNLGVHIFVFGFGFREGDDEGDVILCEPAGVCVVKMFLSESGSWRLMRVLDRGACSCLMCMPSFP
jgi:hypothetical protein